MVKLQPKRNVMSWIANATVQEVADRIGKSNHAI